MGSVVWSDANLMDLTIVPEHNFEHQGMQFRCRDGTCDDDVARSIWEGEYDLPDSSQYEAGSVCLDIGAYFGGYAMWACQRYSGARVLAVEPIPENIRLMRLNLAANGLGGRIEVVEGAAGRMTEISYGDPSTDSGKIHQFIGNGYAIRPGDKTAKVESFSLARLVDFACNRFEVNKIWAVKSDIEGAEDFLFEDAPEEIMRKIQWVTGEFHYGCERLDKLFKSLGFIKHAMPPKNPGLFCYKNPLPFSEC